MSTLTARVRPCAGAWGVAHDSGNRDTDTFLTAALARLEGNFGDHQAALEYSARAIRNFADCGNITNTRAALAALAACLGRLGCYGSAATIAGFAFDPVTAAWVPEINTAITHLREVLGDQTYESLARKGKTMTTAAMATYAYEQIDQARTELEQPN